MTATAFQIGFRIKSCKLSLKKEYHSQWLLQIKLRIIAKQHKNETIKRIFPWLQKKKKTNSQF